MIKLNVYKYCEDCMEFEPRVTQRPKQFDDKFDDKFGDPYWFGDTIVECKNCSHCEAIYKYLKRENENAEN